MCDDLIVTHFFKASVNGSTKVLTETADAHVFVQNEPLNQLWMFFPAAVQANQLDAWLDKHLSDHPAGKGFKSWSFTSYNKDAALKMYKDWNAASFDALYEMRLPALGPGSSRDSCPIGYNIRKDPTFLKSHDPDHSSDAFIQAETTLTIVDERSGRIAGFVTYLVDAETQRVYISAIETFPDFRRRGLAKALMMRSLESEKEGYTIWLTVFAENFGAAALYFGLGFKVHRCLWVVGGANP
ncbi:hypothetical protein CALCODRAFT_512849 [Calocera cornea HHB12733]|uniref:N-acetyltransferase domain-containing protein n=1 Tax=Calocera cornea HHB12733 TaxID=1353952 RepID=A0A165CQH6_9BASI|nr:hypothetical protein CALCODRAFT_512849 [Calocera cornea HHB12733]